MHFSIHRCVFILSTHCAFNALFASGANELPGYISAHINRNSVFDAFDAGCEATELLFDNESAVASLRDSS